MGVRIHDTYEKAGGNKLSLEVLVHIHQYVENKVSGKEYTIGPEGDGSVVFQMIFQHYPNSNELEISVKLTNKDPDDKLVYIINYYQRYGKNKVKRTLTTDDIPWRVIDHRIKIESVNMTNGYRFDPNIAVINIILEVQRTVAKSPSAEFDVPKTTPHLASLHEDTELTDFELQAEDGSVHLHKAIAAAVSPVLRTMFSGAWRETADGVVEVPDTTTATLQHFKDYIYLDTIPEEGVEQLLLLASFYMIPDLEQRCVNKLKNSVTAKTASDLIFLAANNRSHHLLFAILEQVQRGALDIDEIRSHYKTS